MAFWRPSYWEIRPKFYENQNGGTFQWRHCSIALKIRWLQNKMVLSWNVLRNIKGTMDWDCFNFMHWRQAKPEQGKKPIQFQCSFFWWAGFEQHFQSSYLVPRAIRSRYEAGYRKCSWKYIPHSRGQLAAQFEKRSGNIIKERLSTFNGNFKLAKVRHLAGAKGCLKAGGQHASQSGYHNMDFCL